MRPAIKPTGSLPSFLLAAALLAGCSLAASSLTGCDLVGGSDDLSGEVTFATGRSSYTLGSTVTATLANGSSEPLPYNLCPSQLERRPEEKWTRVGPDFMCLGSFLKLAPGAQDRYQIALTDGLAPSEGRYRLTTRVLNEGGESRLPRPLSRYVQPLSSNDLGR